MTYQWDFGPILQYWSLFRIGLEYTLGFTLASAIVGMVAGLLLTLARRSGWKILSIPAGAVVEIFRCTPALVQLVWCYYALPVVLGLSLPPATAALLALSLYGAAFYSEIFRAGLDSIDRGQWDAAAALGMTPFTMMRRIILPQALRRMTAPLVSQVVLQLKNTSLISVVTVPDLVYQGQMVASATYKPLEVYTTIAIIYFLILFPMTQGARLLERRRHG
ncbi:amino acid ABC transporter permease [Nguyenibacter vanlangensis]|uniref:Amino acid ABC transporter permease n=1 Tax=Nguyenibacter vanlangensis TaxID=1216886 RepID=A0ABZ3D942_9PROT